LFQSGLLKPDEAESITSKDQQGYECLNFTQPLHKIGSETRASGATVWFQECYNNLIPEKFCCKIIGILLFSFELHHLVPG
jgi:hypothetical protein